MNDWMIRRRPGRREIANSSLESSRPMPVRKDFADMNPYLVLGSSIGTTEAASLCARLEKWHDAMVAHERRLASGAGTDRCDDECAHAEARVLWREVGGVFGPRSSELTFLRSRALGVGAAHRKIA
jgi:hypothetical protein